MDEKFVFITPDVIYDYFEPLFKKEVYSGEIHQNYVLTTNILSRLEGSSLEWSKAARAYPSGPPAFGGYTAAIRTVSPCAVTVSRNFSFFLKST